MLLVGLPPRQLLLLRSQAAPLLQALQRLLPEEPQGPLRLPLLAELRPLPVLLPPLLLELPRAVARVLPVPERRL